MKMFRKFAALAVAAVLSLGVLSGCCCTAASSYRLQKYLEASETSGQIYMEADTGKSYLTKMAIDGELTAWQFPSNFLIKKEGFYYSKQRSGWGRCYLATPGMLNITEGVLELVPKAEMLSSLRVETEYSVKDQGSFYAEIYETESETLAYCFKDEELKLIVHKKGDTTTAYPVTMSATIPDDILAQINDFRSSQSE